MATTVTNLGIIFDQEILFNDQINQPCRTSFFFFRNLFKIRKYLTDEATSKVVHAFLTTTLDQCNHVYFCLPKYQVKKMQRVKNTAARLVTGSSKYDYITPLLQQLHRFPVSYRVVFKFYSLSTKLVMDCALGMSLNRRENHLEHCAQLLQDSQQHQLQEQIHMEIEHSQSVHQNYGIACLTTSEMLEHCLYLKRI